MYKYDWRNDLAMILLLVVIIGIGFWCGGGQ